MCRCVWRDEFWAQTGTVVGWWFVSDVAVKSSMFWVQQRGNCVCQILSSSMAHTGPRSAQNEASFFHQLQWVGCKCRRSTEGRYLVQSKASTATLNSIRYWIVSQWSVSRWTDVTWSYLPSPPTSRAAAFTVCSRWIVVFVALYKTVFQ